MTHHLPEWRGGGPVLCERCFMRLAYSAPKGVSQRNSKEQARQQIAKRKEAAKEKSEQWMKEHGTLRKQKALNKLIQLGF